MSLPSAVRIVSERLRIRLAIACTLLNFSGLESSPLQHCVAMVAVVIPSPRTFPVPMNDKQIVQQDSTPLPPADKHQNPCLPCSRPETSIISTKYRAAAPQTMKSCSKSDLKILTLVLHPTEQTSVQGAKTKSTC